MAALMLALCACNGNGGNMAPELPLFSQPELAREPLEPLHRDPSHGKVRHIVIVVQENRSFNDLFYGFPQAKTARYGYDTDGRKILLKPIALATTWDLDHSSTSFFEACNGSGRIRGTNCRMNGFNREYAECGYGSNPCPIKHPQYAYVAHLETRPYFDMANQYVLADEMYASNFDASSFVSHQYIISAQAESSVNYPDSAWGCPGGPYDKIDLVGQRRQIPNGQEVVCWDPTTLGDELDQAGVTWAYYAASYSGYPFIWSAYQAIKHIYDHHDWFNDVISPPSSFLKDVSNGKLRAVSWVTPTWRNSDHAGSDSATGPSWVASLVNAVGESKYWDSSAIFIFWDDYGGWYDPEPPAYVDYDGLGFRIPMIVISPYAKRGHVSHVHYEHGSILKFVEDTFGLARLSASDKRAKSPASDCFDFSKPPRTFVPFQAPYNRYYFMHQAADHHIPDSE